MNTCSTCLHYSVSGECYFNPPTPLASGTNLRPRLKPDERACGQYSTQLQETAEKINKKSLASAPRYR